LERVRNGLGLCPMADFGIWGVKTSGSVANKRSHLSINLPDVSSAVCDVPSVLWSLNQIQNAQTEHTIITYTENDVT
jgi:hypothetical protein